MRAKYVIFQSLNVSKLLQKVIRVYLNKLDQFIFPNMLIKFIWFPKKEPSFIKALKEPQELDKAKPKAKQVTLNPFLILN